eukprot:jgi/Chrzof1/5/Cz01g00060.t1
MGEKHRHGGRPFQVLLNVPNSIGWMRLLLWLVAVVQYRSNPHLSFWLFVVNLSLDFLDGLLARALKQTSSFGAVLDVLIDVLCRGWLWATALPAHLAVAPVFLEMLVFAFTHKVGGSHWKQDFFASAPAWIRVVMSHNFKTPIGVFTICGLMMCPLWLWARTYLPGTLFAAAWWGWLLIPGRVLAACVECWVVTAYMTRLVHEDLDAMACELSNNPAAEHTTSDDGENRRDA